MKFKALFDKRRREEIRKTLKGGDDLVYPRKSIDTQVVLDSELFSAAFHGDIKRIQNALGRGAQIESRHLVEGIPEAVTPLIVASLLGRTDAVALLLSKDADPNAVANDLTALGFVQVCLTLHLEIMKLPNAAQNLYLQALPVYPEIVDLLRKHGAKE